MRMQTIDTFAVLNDITQIDLLKIDTEGYELAVLKGAVQSILNTKIILIELSNHDMYFNYDKKEIEQFLLQNNHSHHNLEQVQHKHHYYIMKYPTARHPHRHPH